MIGMTFGELFERAAGVGTDADTDTDAIKQALEAVRTGREERGGRGGRGEHGDRGDRSERNELKKPDTPPETAGTATGRVDGEPTPARVVADADVLAADLLVGETSREALDILRAHAWTTLVASDVLLDDVEAVVASVAGGSLAADWRAQLSAWREVVEQPPGDHPALASAYRGNAMQVISLDATLTGPAAAAGLRGRLPVSVREPRAFAAVFSPKRLYPTVADEPYPGPDRDTRSW